MSEGFPSSNSLIAAAKGPVTLLDEGASCNTGGENFGRDYLERSGVPLCVVSLCFRCRCCFVEDKYPAVWQNAKSEGRDVHRIEVLKSQTGQRDFLSTGGPII